MRQNTGGFRTCPKCMTGMLFVDKDQYGPYVSCRNCGWNRDLAPGKPLPKVQDVDQEYTDTDNDGCLVADSCFECPLPECRYIAPANAKLWLQDRRVLSVFAGYQRLGTVPAVRETARILQVTGRTVYRVLARNKQALAAASDEAIA